MFDVNNAARMIREARIKKNMTQGALADAMSVSYQAVSNWERGNAMPDIGKLGDLCRILNLDLYALLGESGAAELAEQLITEESAAEKCADFEKNGPDEIHYSVKDLIGLAPLLEPETLMKLLSSSKSGVVDMDSLIALAPFVDGDALEELAENVTPENVKQIVALSPFISDESCAHFVEKLEDLTDFTLDSGLICALGPFLSQKKLDQLAERMTPCGIKDMLAAAPFVSESALVGMMEKAFRAEPENKMKGIISLAPFLSEDGLAKVLGNQ